MISEQDAALQRARAFVRDRGWRQEPLTWEEVKVLVEMTENETIEEDHVDCRQDAYDEGHGDGYDEGYTDAEAEFERAKAS